MNETQNQMALATKAPQSHLWRGYGLRLDGTHCNTRRGGETTRMAGSRSASIQEAASEEEGGVTSERLVILEASQANLSVKFTSAQLLARAQDINSREELVERLWAQTQRNQLEMQALALQLDQERAGYLNQLANKEDEVQEPVVILAKDAEEEITRLKRHVLMQEQQISKFERILERVVGNESESSQGPSDSRSSKARGSSSSARQPLGNPSCASDRHREDVPQPQNSLNRTKTANPAAHVHHAKKCPREAVLNRRIPNETGVLVREAGFRPPIHPPIQPRAP
ncbi:hypothetical protein IMY05_C2442000100 [Salix suchowensis]|nr:hypothetical protein IMY05_C2442000100 [Salix suchowensis]